MSGIKITERAVTKFKEFAENNGTAGTAMRVGIRGGGCSGFSYKMDFETKPPLAGDKIFEFSGVKVYVDPASMMYLDGTEIDYVETLEGAGFKFVNPNVKTTCGCGESFTV